MFSDQIHVNNQNARAAELETYVVNVQFSNGCAINNKVTEASVSYHIGEKSSNNAHTISMSTEPSNRYCVLTIAWQNVENMKMPERMIKKYGTYLYRFKSSSRSREYPATIDSLMAESLILEDINGTYNFHTVSVPLMGLMIFFAPAEKAEEMKRAFGVKQRSVM
ncbi:MAG: hypothetical protein WCJ19_04360 [bacterium]